jgi:hypothetical protein
LQVLIDHVVERPKGLPKFSAGCHEVSVQQW